MKPSYIFSSLILMYSLFTCADNTQGLFHAVNNNNFKKFEELLLDGPELVDARDKIGTPLLIYCLKHNRDSMASYLLKKGVDVNAKDTDGRNALFYVKSPQYLPLILGGGADVNCKDNYGWTPLHVLDDIEVFDGLFKYAENKLEVNARNNNKITPLMWAIQQDDIKKVRILLNYGADINFEDANGLSCVDYANRSGNPRIKQVIQEKYNEEILQKTISITKILDLEVNLDGGSYGIKNSMAINNFRIPGNCDELLLVGYVGKNRPSELETLVEALGKTGSIVFGEKAEQFYEAYKNLQLAFSSESASIDFYITTKRDGEELRKNFNSYRPDKFFFRNNVPGFHDRYNRGDNLPPSNDMSVVLINKERIKSVPFRIEIFSVSFPQLPQAEVDSDFIEYEQPSVNKAEILPGVDVQVTLSDPGKAPSQAQAQEPGPSSYEESRLKELNINTFYAYPTLEPIEVEEDWLIQGAAERSFVKAVERAEQYAAISELEVIIFKQSSGDFPFKILVEACQDRSNAYRRCSYINDTFAEIGELSEAYVISKNNLLGN